MDFKEILILIQNYVPIPVIVAVIGVIFMTYATQWIAEAAEKYVENKTGNLNIFEHKRFLLNVLYSAIFTATIAAAQYITWKEYVFYVFVIIGASSTLYEIFLKKIGKSNAGES